MCCGKVIDFQGQLQITWEIETTNLTTPFRNGAVAVSRWPLCSATSSATSLSRDSRAGLHATYLRFLTLASRFSLVATAAYRPQDSVVRAHFNAYHLRRSSSCQSRRSASQRSSFTPRARSSCGRKLHPAPHS
ncbi:DNA topoisomerase [Trichophyton equinum CBS 127.97]|uniref:DNA topoisomerase n=1 Tax=Trichophyton equinum (strain ATCC MYA-4606 / CBS 127.97) TaxID=559882 RepID=F2PMV4_TRIEC|nr:DNA topoisomerase [Trichophyton equinum CBS 127.97]